MPPPVELPPLKLADILGRRVSSRAKAGRARRGIVVHDIFLGKEEDDCLSVNRLDHAPDQTIAEIADTAARLGGSAFHGWATVTAKMASQDGRSVRPDPVLDNPYHAEIDLNVTQVAERRDIQKRHATALAAAAQWRDRP